MRLGLGTSKAGISVKGLLRRRFVQLAAVILALPLLYVGVMAAMTVRAAVFSSSKTQSSFTVPGSPWSTYQGNSGRSGYNPAETSVTSANAANLTTHWSSSAGGSISAQPASYGGLIYWGSWDGYEHAVGMTGNIHWATYIGKTTAQGCDPVTAGVASTPAIGRVPIGTRNFLLRTVLFVGGGDGQFYALDANSGAILWKTRLGPSPSTFIWSSPLFYNGFIYVGVSSFGDCPLVQGKIVQLNGRTGQILNTFNTVPNGCVGGGVWGTPALDKDTGQIYFTTGNPDTCASPTPYAEAIVEVSAQNLSLTDSWQVPPAQLVDDSDFGATPTLFTATINGVQRNLLGAVNKNGIYYALDRSAIASGPVWQTRVGNGGDCPQCGSGNISPSAWDGTTLYVAGGATTVNVNGTPTSCGGSVGAINPATGAYLWQDCYGAPVLSPVAGSADLIFVTEGTSLRVINTANGQLLYTFTDSSGSSLFYGGASISGGQIFAGNMDGTLYAIGL